MRDSSFQTVALVGCPNSGKTTLFNLLTGSRQKTGNYAGVTVEKKEGFWEIEKGLSVQVVDLPGTYSIENPQAPDERITSQVVSSGREDLHPHGLIAIADSTNLATNLYLVLELKDRGLPMVLVLAMSDLARRKGISIDAEKLEAMIGVPVILVSSIQKTGLSALKQEVAKLLRESREILRSETGKTSPTKIIQRYQVIEDVIKQCVKRERFVSDLTKRIDQVVLHRIWGPLLLLLSFAVLFQLIFSLAEVPMDWIESGVAWLQTLGRLNLPEGFLKSALVDGVLAGVGSVVVFLPQILILFAFIIVLEDSGYMARAAFILDRLMGGVGLHGRAFLPLLSSFACAVPGIMATRTIENRRDRLITILIAPLMTCSARIPVYTMLIGAFPKQKIFGLFNLPGLVLFALYLAGISVALVVAWVLRRFFCGEKAPFVIELPEYKRPLLRNLLLGLSSRAMIFLRRAGTIILVTSILLWAAVTFPAGNIENTVAGRLGKAIEPVLQPLGFDWKIGVGILASLAAREVVLSTLGTVYSIEYSDEHSGALAERLAHGFWTGARWALSLLVFYVLACQCISTLAVVRRETNSFKWPAILFTYMTLLAYFMAMATYQIAKMIL